LESSPGQTVQKSLSQKHTTQNWADGVAQVVEHLLSKPEALSLNTNSAPLPPAKKKERNVSKRQNYRDRTSISELGVEMRNGLQIGMKFLWGIDRSILKLDSGDGCRTLIMYYKLFLCTFKSWIW
jgi:hypothetical protein